MDNYFTIKSANEMLPTIIEKFQKIKQEKNEVEKMEQKLQMNLSGTSNLDDYVTLKQNLNASVTRFYISIEELEKTGVVLKGLEEGLLDFPSKKFDDEIWLCWKEGETEIKFWHEKDVGFNGRKPIDVNKESLV
ncbi:MAG TPA: DUF2203 domain-containing protein [Candidatus Nitrosopelagicus sp.]|jgi:hypothetical protein|nr:DUF2203 domain-containing protein [Candidatus Nitrosopelagicus sp.]HJN19890.1 DUF2203 domain-containing protein [Candidatus Nitrosopelagicus sp.]|tara:strand:+ start:674 stop:1075 length:402 start_codon:yes stop_codon:yes gene_type:complete